MAQAGTYFPKVTRIVAFFFKLLRGHLALATLSPPETDPHILERSGYADEVQLGKSIRAKDFGVECWHDVPRLL